MRASAVSFALEKNVSVQHGAPLPSALAIAAKGRCPRCGEGKLFDGFLTVRTRCDVCGLDYAFADAGDGPAVFVIFFAGFLVAGLALVVEFAYEPPYFIHALLWGPLALIVTVGPLRPLKALMIALQYRFQSGEQPHPARKSRESC
jgi:uncharacterized protein (DUF983 family)